MNLLDTFLELLYPPRCIICDEPILSHGYCDSCKGKLKPIKEEMCLVCGSTKKKCECNKRIYHFDGITAPYFNEGYAKQAVYDLKFYKKFNCVKTFGKDMAKFVKKNFGCENIDLICCVPAGKQSLYERGFNQTELFASEISKYLNIKLNPKLLIKLKKVKSQHRLKTIQDRFDNVRNGYKVTGRLDGENILLVDDIKTTGATIDECARQLKFAGANNVYCVVALLSKLHDGTQTYDL